MTTDPASHTGPPETARQAAELQALRRTLAASLGTFSLSIAVCNSPALRDYLIEKLSSDDDAISVFSVPADTLDVLDAARVMIRDNDPSALFLVNVEKSLPSSRDQHPVLAALNASRESWQEAYACPVVFWLPEYAAALLSVQARDFWAWRSHQFEFEFVSEEATAAAGVQDHFAGGIGVLANLDADAKRFRIAELEQRISDAGEPPSPPLDGHVAAWLNELGYLFLALGHLDQAEKVMRQTLHIDEKLESDAGRAATYGNLGLVCQMRGDLDQAEEMHRKSLEIEEKLGRRECMADDYGNLGLVYRKRGDLDRAEEMHRKSLDINEKLGRPEGIANEYGNLGLVYQKRGELDRAEEMLRRSLEVYEELGRLEGMARSYGNLGMVFGKRGDLDRAEEMFRKSLEMSEKLGLPEWMASQYGNLGLVYEQRGDMELAREYWTRARDLFEQIGMPHKVDKRQRWIDELPGADDTE